MAEELGRIFGIPVYNAERVPKNQPRWSQHQWIDALDHEDHLHVHFEEPYKPRYVDIQDLKLGQWIDVHWAGTDETAEVMGHEFSQTLVRGGRYRTIVRFRDGMMLDLVLPEGKRVLVVHGWMSVIDRMEAG